MAENNPYANIGTLSPDQFQQQQELNRQQRMAEMLSQNNQQPQGQMIGNRFVAPSWAAQLAPAVNMIAGAYLGKKADENALAYAKQLRAGEESAMADYLKELQGKPAVPASSVQPTIAGKPMRDDETGALYPPIVTQGTPAMPANPQRAHANAALNYNLPAFARQNAMTQLFAQPKEFDLPEGAKRYKEMPDGTIKEVAAGGEKVHPVKGNLVTSSGKVLYSAPAEAGEGFGGEGRFNKKGDYIAPNGVFIGKSEVAKDREIARAANELRQGLQQISPEDIKKTETVLGDVTQNGVKKYLASQLGNPALKAQAKINASAVMQTLQNLPPGPASDKDIMQAKSSFPGYGNAQDLQDWVNNTNTMLERKINNVNSKYGSEDWYGAQGVSVKPTTPVAGSPKIGEVRQGYRFKGGDQYDQKNWEKI